MPKHLKEASIWGSVGAVLYMVLSTVLFIFLAGESDSSSVAMNDTCSESTMASGGLRHDKETN